MTDFKIRTFEPADRAAVIRVWTDSGLVKPQNDPNRDIDRKLTTQAEWFLVGAADGRIVATCMAGYDGHRGWVNYLSVTPAMRHRGLGRKMMQAVEEQLRAVGCPKINLQVRDTNTVALGFYEALGYAVDRVTSLGKRLIDDHRN